MKRSGVWKKIVPSILSTITGTPIWPLSFGGLISNWYFASLSGGPSMNTVFTISTRVSSFTGCLLQQIEKDELGLDWTS